MNGNGLASKSDKREEARAEFARLIDQACSRGFHGTAGVTVNVQDGTIQHLRVHVERMIK